MLALFSHAGAVACWPRESLREAAKAMVVVHLQNSTWRTSPFCLSPAKLRSTDSVYPRVVLSRVLSPAMSICSKSQTVLARYQWTDNKSYKDQSYKGPGLNSKLEKEKERREEEGATTASSHRKEQRQRRRT